MALGGGAGSWPDTTQQRLLGHFSAQRGEEGDSLLSSQKLAGLVKGQPITKKRSSAWEAQVGATWHPLRSCGA